MFRCLFYVLDYMQGQTISAKTANISSEGLLSFDLLNDDPKSLFYHIVTKSLEPDRWLVTRTYLSLKCSSESFQWVLLVKTFLRKKTGSLAFVFWS